MRTIAISILLAMPFIMADVAVAAPGEEAASRGASVTNTYRLTLNEWSGTGVAIATQGYVLTTMSLVNHCADMHDCSVWVGDDSETPTWRRSTLVATDPATGLAVLHTESALPSAATLATRAAVPSEPVHTYGYGEPGGSHFRAAHVVTADLMVRFREDRPNGHAILTNLDCPSGDSGSGVFAVRDDALLGILVGEIDADTSDRTGGILIPSGTIRAFLDAHGIPYARPRPPRRHSRR